MHTFVYIFVYLFFLDSWGNEAMERDLDHLNATMNGSPSAGRGRSKSRRLQALRDSQKSTLEWTSEVKEILRGGTDDGLKVLLL